MTGRHTEIAVARAELADALAALEDKLNIPKQSRLAMERARRSFERNPVPWIIGTVATVAAVGGLIALAVARR